MRCALHIAAFAFAAISCPSAACLADVWFRGTGEVDTRPRAIDYSGRIVVGDHYSDAAAQTGWRLDIADTQPQQIAESSSLLAIGRYGAQAVGAAIVDGHEHPFAYYRSPWNSEESSYTMNVVGRANGASNDGYLVGAMEVEDRNSAFISGYPSVTDLGDFPGGAHDSAALGISAQWHSVVGYGTTDQGRQAFLWRGFNSDLIGLGDLTDKHVDSVAYAISSDGKIIVGAGSNSQGESEAFRWTESDGMIGLDPLDLVVRSSAQAVSTDGRVIVGGLTLPDGTEEAFLWNPVAGIRSISGILSQKFGQDLSGWQLLNATGLSYDGLTIVGEGINPSGQREGWIASIPRGPITGDTNGDGYVDLEDLNNVINNLAETGPIGATPGDTYPFDGRVDLNDFNATRNYFGMGGDLAAVPEPQSLAIALVAASIAILAASRRKCAAVARTILAFVIALAAGTTSAATIQLTPHIIGVFNLDSTPVDPELIIAPGVLRSREASYWLQIEVRMRITDLQPGQIGFSNTAMDIVVSGDGYPIAFEELGSQYWLPDQRRVHTHGTLPGGNYPLWDRNSDAGADPNDLRTILLANVTHSFGPSFFDPRPWLGQGPTGDEAGWIVVEVPGRSSLTIVDITAPLGGSTFDETGFSTTAGNTAVGSTLVIRTPEPATLPLLAIAALASICLARGHFVIRISTCEIQKLPGKDSNLE